MGYIKNIFLASIIGVVIGFFVGSIFDSKVTKKSVNWEEKQERQQIIFSVLGAIGGIIVGVKISDEENAR
jgi:outer membrane lipoprotein SlyB